MLERIDGANEVEERSEAANLARLAVDPFIREILDIEGIA